jgi:hypothetical protein
MRPHAPLRGADLLAARAALGLGHRDIVAVLRCIAHGHYMSKRQLRRIETTKDYAFTDARSLLVLTALGIAVRERMDGSTEPIDSLLLYGPSHLSRYAHDIPALPAGDSCERCLLDDIVTLIDELVAALPYHDDTLTTIDILRLIASELHRDTGPA